MIDEGAEAPRFELPAVVDGEFERVGLGEYLGRDVVILAFYPADFNPACGDGTTDLDELDLFTMQKDVSILGISADSVYSHRAFAAEYDLHVPLLSDLDGSIAAEYGVARTPTDDEATAGYLVDRAVVVVAPDGEVVYTWTTDDLEELPPVEAIRDAVQDVGGADTARARYRVGHAHYVEGRRAFTSAMHSFDDEEWMVAQSDFARATEEFEEAEDGFNAASRFAESERERTFFDRAEAKAEALWQAADWLTDAASAYASGEGARGLSMRRDAETPLETARGIHEPVDPDDFPPDEDPAEFAEHADSGTDFFHGEDDESTSLDLAVDDETAQGPPQESEECNDDESTTSPGNVDGAGDGTTTGVDESEPSQGTAADGTAAEAETRSETAGDEERDDAIDDDELAEITAELEEQTAAMGADEDADETAAESRPDDGAGGARVEGDEGVGEGEAGERDEDDVELDLTDPTEGEGLDPLEDEADDERAEDESDDDADDSGAEESSGSADLGSGDHGVPDSL